jgi:NTP pyrophosphatase (non-canonical NTP hydrolase)
MEKFKEVWKEVSEIDKEDDCLLSEAVCKFVEEFGELSTEINKVIGRKSTNESKEDIRENILEESADVIQNLLLIFNRLGLDPDELLDKVRVKNEKWKSVIPLRKKNEI